MFKGRWKVKELKVHWYCRNCLQKGVAGITLQPTIVPPKNEISQMIQLTCHSKCKQPDIRIHYEKKETVH